MSECTCRTSADWLSKFSILSSSHLIGISGWCAVSVLGVALNHESGTRVESRSSSSLDPHPAQWLKCWKACSDASMQIVKQPSGLLLLHEENKRAIGSRVSQRPPAIKGFSEISFDFSYVPFLRQIRGYSGSTSTPSLAKSDEVWRTLANPQHHIQENPPDIHQSSGEGPPPSPEFW